MQVRVQQQTGELDALLAAVDEEEATALAALDEAGTRRHADAVRPTSSSAIAGNAPKKKHAL